MHINHITPNVDFFFKRKEGRKDIVNDLDVDQLGSFLCLDFPKVGTTFPAQESHLRVTDPGNIDGLCCVKPMAYNNPICLLHTRHTQIILMRSDHIILARASHTSYVVVSFIKEKI